MKQKGFTLIELLAVIVILAIIALIAMPMVLNTIEKSKKGAASSSAYAYVSEVETRLTTYMLNNGGTSYNKGKHTVSELQTDLKVEVKGDIPSEGNICIGSDGTVTSASIKINGYVVSYDGNNATTTDLSEIEDITCDTTSDEVVDIKVGDYVKMTPTSTSYTIPASLTGRASNQTINPSELNLWRVIKINSDGTIEMVSEKVSSTEVYFQGQTGYKNFVGALNTIAKQYENSNYTIGSRHMGYNGQTEYLTDTANTVDSTSTTAPWSCLTGESCNPIESQGGGDTLYTTDTDLVTNALGTLVANNPSGPSTYWLASRSYFYYSSSRWYFFGRVVYASGSILNSNMYYYNSGFSTTSSSRAVRPIVTLKSGLTKPTESGTSGDPWVLG